MDIFLVTVRILLAAFLGSIIGIERKLKIGRLVLEPIL